MKKINWKNEAGPLSQDALDHVQKKMLEVIGVSDLEKYLRKNTNVLSAETIRQKKRYFLMLFKEWERQRQKITKK